MGDTQSSATERRTPAAASEAAVKRFEDETAHDQETDMSGGGREVGLGIEVQEEEGMGTVVAGGTGRGVKVETEIEVGVGRDIVHDGVCTRCCFMFDLSHY